MIMCPNFSNPEVAREFEELKNATSEAAAYHIWSLNNGNAIDRAPNGAPSKLFLTLLEHYNGDRTKAIQAKAKCYGNSFLNWFGDWTHNSNTEPKVKFYAPTMGKTTAAKSNPNLVDFDDLVREDIKKLADKLGKTVREVKTESGKEYKQLLLDAINEWKNNPENIGKTLVVSNAVLAKEKFFDNNISIPSRDVFVRRLVERSEEDKSNEELTREAELYYDDLLFKWYDNPTIDNRYVSDIENSNISRVVDENGEPLVVYHGGSRRIGETGEFIIPHETEELVDQNGELFPGREFNLGAFFSSDKEYAEHFKWGRGDEYMYPVFLNIKNPAYPDKLSSSVAAEVYDKNWINTQEGFPEFDGIIGHDAKTLDFVSTGTEYAVYNSNQIKSIDNQGPTPWEGTYSKENDNIYYNLKYLKLNTIDDYKTLFENILRDYYNFHRWHGLRETISKSTRNINKEDILKILNWFNLPSGTIYLNEFETGVKFNDTLLSENLDNLKDLIQDTTPIDIVQAVRVIKMFLQKFPQIKGVKIATSDKWNGKFENGYVYLNPKTFTSVAIEECLHPFVEALFDENPQLFDNLLKQAQKEFKTLRLQIANSYKDKKGFTVEDRQKELVTQALSKHLANIINNKEKQDSIWKKAWSWILNKLGLNDISQISEKTTLQELAEQIYAANNINIDDKYFDVQKYNINAKNTPDVVTPSLRQQLEFKKADLKGEIRKLYDKINTLERNFIRKIPGKNMVLSTPYGDLASTYGFIDNNAPSIFGKVSARFKMNKNNIESSLLFPNKWMFTPDNNYTRLKNSLRSNQPQIAYNLLEYLKLQGFNRVYNDWLLEHKVLDTQIPDVDLGVMGLGMFLEMSGKYASDELIEEFDQLYGKGAGQLLSVEKRPDPNYEKATQFRVSANIDELLAKIKQNNPEVRVSNDYIELIKSTQDASHERSEEDKQMARSEIEKLDKLALEYADQIKEIEKQIKQEKEKEFDEWRNYLKTLGGDMLENSCSLPF